VTRNDDDDDNNNNSVLHRQPNGQLQLQHKK
jgi:hypothetical protein